MQYEDEGNYIDTRIHIHINIHMYPIIYTLYTRHTTLPLHRTRELAENKLTTQ